MLPTTRRTGIGTIIQVGDLGYWPEARKFFNAARNARQTFDVDVWFIDGNHKLLTTLNRNVFAAQATFTGWSRLKTRCSASARTRGCADWGTRP